jgi:hypothetical protein
VGDKISDRANIIYIDGKKRKWGRVFDTKEGITYGMRTSLYGDVYEAANITVFKPPATNGYYLQAWFKLSPEDYSEIFPDKPKPEFPAESKRGEPNEINYIITYGVPSKTPRDMGFTTCLSWGVLQSGSSVHACHKKINPGLVWELGAELAQLERLDPVIIQMLDDIVHVQPGAADKQKKDPMKELYEYILGNNSVEKYR